MRCLALLPAARPASADELARSLLLAGGAVSVAEERSGRRGWWAGLGALALVAGVGLAWSAWRGVGSSAPPPEPEVTPGSTKPTDDLVSPPEPNPGEPSRADEAQRWVEEGDRKFNLRRYTEAVEDFDRALQLDPNSAFAYANRGISKGYLGRFAEAIDDFDMALQLDPNDALVYSDRGLANARLGRYAEAIEDFDRALALGLEANVAAQVRTAREDVVAELARD